jgi:hypothetical protein
MRAWRSAWGRRPSSCGARSAGGRGEGERDRQPPGLEAEARVEADVVHRARHRLEPDRARALRRQPLHARAYDALADPRLLHVGPHGEGPHPPFRTGEMHDVEGDDPAALVAPEHRALARVVDGVAPDRRVQEGHAHPHHAVATIALAEGVAEDLVERPQVADRDVERTVGLGRRTAVGRGRHQSPTSTVV